MFSPTVSICSIHYLPNLFIKSSVYLSSIYISIYIFRWSTLSLLRIVHPVENYTATGNTVGDNNYGAIQLFIFPILQLQYWTFRSFCSSLLFDITPPAQIRPSYLSKFRFSKTNDKRSIQDSNANRVAFIRLKRIIIMMGYGQWLVKTYPYSSAFKKHHTALKLI